MNEPGITLQATISLEGKVGDKVALIFKTSPQTYKKKMMSP